MIPKFLISCILLCSLLRNYGLPRVLNYFSSLCRPQNECFTDFSPRLEILEVQSVAHHDGSRANKLIRLFVSLYRRHANNSSSPLSVLCAADALCSLHLYLSTSSPLTTAPLTDNALWDAEDDSFVWLDKAWAGEKPPPTGSPSESAVSDSVSPTSSPLPPTNSASYGNDWELECLTWQLCGNPEHRMNLLSELYPSLPISFVRVRAAYLLATIRMFVAKKKKLNKKERKCLGDKAQ